ncbi:MAG: hypothetical protein M1815_001670 [Lichina confinis]|nr:MAG: hypothetical protein M1815_001670 [Lichina confinis]
MPDIDTLPNSTVPSGTGSRHSSVSSNRHRPGGGVSPLTERPRPTTTEAAIGELHERMEEEQEGQVNRLLRMINAEHNHLGGASAEDSTPPSDLSTSFPGPGTAHRLSFDLARQPSRSSQTPSRTTSPALRPLSVGLNPHGEGSEAGSASGGSVRDEAAFYQIETKNLTRENQLLKRRIRELERQISGEQPDQEAHQHSNAPTPGATAPTTASRAASSSGHSTSNRQTSSSSQG